MENNKINIAELLEKCPKGTKLYSPIFGDVYLDKIRPHLAIIVTTDRYKEEFLYDGRYGMNGECMLFPSKDQRDWSKFQRPLVDGDILACNQVGNKNPTIYIYCHNEANRIEEYYIALIGCNKLKLLERGVPALLSSVNENTIRIATEEEKQKLFDVIKKNGYYWNEETKALEELIVPKFKVGDRIRHKLTKGVYEIQMVLPHGGGVYEVKVTDKLWKSIAIECQDAYELVPNKFDITTLVPFESRVLVRHNKYNKWCGAFFSYIDNDTFTTTAGKSYPMMIPYENNEHLLGKIDDCDPYYKTWKE